MKGIVFTEFMEMVEDQFSADLVDQLIDECDLPSKGIYTSVGTYSSTELFQLVSALSKHTKVEAQALVKAFGEYLFGRFVILYPAMFENVDGCFSFLQSIDRHIHVEVKKLMPEAKLPKFDFEVKDEKSMTLYYQSERALADFADGLIIASIAYFKENISLESNIAENKKNATFVLVKS